MSRKYTDNDMSEKKKTKDEKKNQTHQTTYW